MDVLTYGLLNKKIKEAQNITQEKIVAVERDIESIRNDLEYFLPGAGEDLLKDVTHTSGCIVWDKSKGQPSSAYPNYKYYDFVEIEPNTPYSLDSAGSFSNFYDADKQYIHTSTDKTFVSPNNAKYIIVSGLSNETRMLFCIKEYVTNMLDGVVETHDCIVWDKSKGQPSSAYPNYKYYDFVEIEPNTPYSLDSAGSFSNFYDADKQYIRTSTDKTFVSPNNAKYIIVSGLSNEARTLFSVKEMEAVNINNNNILSDIEKLNEGIAKTYVVDINGNGDFTSVLEACVEAIKTKNSKVLIKSGTYDIKAEALALYGSSYTGAGVMLQNGIHIIGDSDAYLICDNRGGSDTFRENFSIFNAGSGDFILENINMVGYNIRYNVHDERGNSNDESANHKYIGCNMYLDNQEYNSSHPNTMKWQCIGGGLGKRANILVESCIFESIGATSTDGIVSYHGNGAGESVGTIVIKDNYFKTGTVRFGDYGTHSKKTNCIVSNNKLCGEIIHAPEITGQNLNHFDVYAWGNIIE